MHKGMHCCAAAQQAFEYYPTNAVSGLEAAIARYASAVGFESSRPGQGLQHEKQRSLNKVAVRRIEVL